MLKFRASKGHKTGNEHLDNSSNEGPDSNPPETTVIWLKHSIHNDGNDDDDNGIIKNIIMIRP